jgi:proteasome lid subunit RPN8/RPN11
MMTEGQEWALSQLHEIGDASEGQLEVLAVREPSAFGAALAVTVSVDCRGYGRAEGGLPLRARERFAISIPSEFPLDRPNLNATHARFAGFPHVQWGKHICLYQAPDSEWRPDDGMFGFIQRFDEWLRQAARGEFDPIGFPLHPPVAYQSLLSVPMVVPTVNAPVVEPPFWVGYAEITAETDVRAELGRWVNYQDEIPKARLAAAMLLPSDMPCEFPTSMKELAEVLDARSIPISLVQIVLKMAALRNEPGKPLYFVLGAAMRGISGDAERLQHLACWFVKAEQADKLSELAMNGASEEVAAREFTAWTEDTPIAWCDVREDRPEIVRPRDQGSPLSWWRGKRVTILGCGAIGSVVAMLLARAGVAKARLYDNGFVAPGILIRQNFRRRQIGYTKVSATRVNMREIVPSLEVDAHNQNIVSAIRLNPDVVFDADVVINATASARVGAALEKYLRVCDARRPPIASLVVGHRADMAMMTYSVEDATGVTLDLDRRVKIACANSISGKDLLNEFWPLSVGGDKLFQPEPGCSDPTFVGSAADVFGLSSRMLNVLSRWLSKADDDHSRAVAINANHLLEESRVRAGLEWEWTKDRVIDDPRQGYQIRLSESAENVLKGWIRTSNRKFGDAVETGGLLFGQIDEFLKVVWVNEVSGPPPDSVASPLRFVCGVQGTAELNAEKAARTRDAVRFVGMWHTHPEGPTRPSFTDLRAMSKLWSLPGFSARHFLMLIVGGPQGALEFEGHLFGRKRKRI